MHVGAFITSVCGVAFLVGCGSAPPPAPEVASSQPQPMAAKRSGGMQVEGLLGTIPPRKIEATLQAKLPEFQRCFFEGANEVEMLAGYMKFYFRVGLDGRVEWVHPRGSSVGHRATESCLLTRAAKVRFPEPKGGGPAEFVWGFEIEATDGVRPPVTLDAGQVDRVVEQHRSELSACEVHEPGHYKVTVYVAPGGKVLAAGAAADSQPAADRIDCITHAVQTWPFPDPGSYAAKVTFGM
jgi:hypothetical protein